MADIKIVGYKYNNHYSDHSVWLGDWLPISTLDNYLLLNQEGHWCKVCFKIQITPDPNEKVSSFGFYLNTYANISSSLNPFQDEDMDNLKDYRIITSGYMEAYLYNQDITNNFTTVHPKNAISSNTYTSDDTSIFVTTKFSGWVTQFSRNSNNDFRISQQKPVIHCFAFSNLNIVEKQDMYVWIHFHPYYSAAMSSKGFYNYQNYCSSVFFYKRDIGINEDGSLSKASLQALITTHYNSFVMPINNDVNQFAYKMNGSKTWQYAEPGEEIKYINNGSTFYIYPILKPNYYCEYNKNNPYQIEISGSGIQYSWDDLTILPPVTITLNIGDADSIYYKINDSEYRFAKNELDENNNIITSLEVPVTPYSSFYCIGVCDDDLQFVSNDLTIPSVEENNINYTPNIIEPVVVTLQFSEGISSIVCNDKEYFENTSVSIKYGTSVKCYAVLDDLYTNKKDCELTTFENISENQLYSPTAYTPVNLNLTFNEGIIAIVCNNITYTKSTTIPIKYGTSVRCYAVVDTENKYIAGNQCGSQANPYVLNNLTQDVDYTPTAISCHILSFKQIEGLNSISYNSNKLNSSNLSVILPENSKIDYSYNLDEKYYSDNDLSGSLILEEDTILPLKNFVIKPKTVTLVFPDGYQVQLFSNKNIIVPAPKDEYNYESFELNGQLYPFDAVLNKDQVTPFEFLKPLLNGEPAATIEVSVNRVGKEKKYSLIADENVGQIYYQINDEEYKASANSITLTVRYGDIIKAYALPKKALSGFASYYYEGNWVDNQDTPLIIEVIKDDKYQFKTLTLQPTIKYSIDNKDEEITSYYYKESPKYRTDNTNYYLFEYWNYDSTNVNFPTTTKAQMIPLDVRKQIYVWKLANSEDVFTVTAVYQTDGNKISTISKDWNQIYVRCNNKILF